MRPDRGGRRVQDPPVLAAGREDGDGLHASSSFDHRRPRTRHAPSGARRARASAPGRCRSPVAGRADRPRRWSRPRTGREPSGGCAARRRRPRARPRSGACRRRRSRPPWPGSPRPSPRTRTARATSRDPARVRVRSSVRCFSMIVAPSAVAAIGSSVPGRVVRPAGLQPERVAHRPHRRQVRVHGRGRVGGDAMEQRQLGQSGRSDRVDRCGDLGHRRPSRSRRSSGGPCGRGARGRAGSSSSPEPTLKPGTSIASRSSAEASSNGVERNTMPRSRGVALQTRPRHRSAGRAARASPADPRPGRRRAGTRRSGQSPTARASGTKVWNLTASAPASAAASMSRCAISTSPSWFTPASAMTKTPSPAPPIERSARRNGATARVPSSAAAIRRSAGSSMSIGAFRRRREANGHARLDEPAARAGARRASSRRTRR